MCTSSSSLNRSAAHGYATRACGPGVAPLLRCLRRPHLNSDCRLNWAAARWPAASPPQASGVSALWGATPAGRMVSGWSACKAASPTGGGVMRALVAAVCPCGTQAEAEAPTPSHVRAASARRAAAGAEGQAEAGAQPDASTRCLPLAMQPRHQCDGTRLVTSGSAGGSRGSAARVVSHSRAQRVPAKGKERGATACRQSANATASLRQGLAEHKRW